MADEPTLPPVREPNTPRVWLKKAWAWLQANPIWFAAIGGALVGLILPTVARMLFS